jgi:hypothetical protein
MIFINKIIDFIRCKRIDYKMNQYIRVGAIKKY